MRLSKNANIWSQIGGGVAILFWLAFFFYPLGNILRLSFTWQAVQELISNAYYGQLIAFTTGQAALSTLLTLLLGLPLSYVWARYQFAGKTVLRALITVPFVLPTVAVAAAFRALWGNNGLINQWLIDFWQLEQAPIRLDQTLAMILLAHIFYNVAIVIRLVGGFWANLNPRLSEAAQLLGANPRRVTWEITLPLLRPALIGATLLIFLFSFTSFGVILVLGGPQFSTLETEIYYQYVTFLRPDLAGLLSIIQIMFTLLLMVAYNRWQPQTTWQNLHPQQANLRPLQTPAEKIAVTGLVLLALFFLLSPLLALVGRSLMGQEGEWTLAYYLALGESRRGSITFISPWVAVRNSIGYAILTMGCAGTLALLTANLLTQPNRWRKWLEPLLMLPLGTSAVTLGLGYVISYRQLRTSAWLVLVAHILIAFPFVLRAILPILRGIQPHLRQAAAVMGANPYQVWREVDLPIIGRALLVGMVFAFTVSMGEFGATSFIVRPNSGYLTLPIAIERYLGQPGASNFGQALAMSTILMVVCALSFVAIERFRYGDVAEF